MASKASHFEYKPQNRLISIDSPSQLGSGFCARPSRYRQLQWTESEWPGDFSAPVSTLPLLKKRSWRGLAPPPHYVSGDYESDKSEHDLEARRHTLTCGRSCVADGVDVFVIAAYVDHAVGDGG